MKGCASHWAIHKATSTQSNLSPLCSLPHHQVLYSHSNLTFAVMCRWCCTASRWGVVRRSTWPRLAPPSDTAACPGQRRDIETQFTAVYSIYLSISHLDPCRRHQSNQTLPMTTWTLLRTQRSDGFLKFSSNVPTWFEVCECALFEISSTLFGIHPNVPTQV